MITNTHEPNDAVLNILHFLKITTTTQSIAGRGAAGAGGAARLQLATILLRF